MINVKRPTIEHCKHVCENGGWFAVREYFNWFLIKYGSGNYFIADGCIAPVIGIIWYVHWCRKFLEENNDER